MPKSKEFIATSSSEDSDGDYTPKKKKVKVEKKVEKKKPSADADDGPAGMMPLSRMRFVSVSEFRGKKLVNIREYYEADGEMKPGRKGISLSIDQWEKLKGYMDDVDSQLKG